MKSFDEKVFLDIVSSVLKTDPSKPGLRMGQTAGWDSVAHLDLIFQLERAFDANFDLEKVAELDSVESLRFELKRILGP